MPRVVVTVLLVLAAAVQIGCAVAPRGAVAPPDRRPRESPNLWVYLRGDTAVGGGLDVRIDALRLRDGSGGDTTIPLRIDRLDASTFRRSTLLAIGAVPPGRYTGVSLGISGATLESPDGPVALEIADPPPVAAVSFEIRTDTATVLRLEFLPGASIRDGRSFEPALRATVPDPLAEGLRGYASIPDVEAIVDFDRLDGAVVRVVKPGGRPSGLALDFFRQRLYVGLEDRGRVLAINTQDLRIIDRVELGLGDEPSRLALTPDGLTVVVANRGSGTVSLVDARGLFERARVRVGDGPADVVLDDATGLAWVANEASDSVSVVDVARGIVIGTIRTDSAPYRLRLDPLADRLYVAHRMSSNVSILDTATRSIVERLLVGPDVTALALTGGGSRLYVARDSSPSVEIFDPASLLPVEAFDPPPPVSDFTVDPEANRLLLLTPRDDGLRVVRLVGQGEAYRVDLGGAPYEVVLGSGR